MSHEGRRDEPEADVLDLTRKRRARANKGRDPDRAAEPTDAQDALDRDQSALDREQADLDRHQSALERRRAHPSGDADRDQAGLDRDQAALGRKQAGLDRDQAALDREAPRRQDNPTDDLTGTLRRGPGLQELQHEIDRARRRGEPLVVAFIDVDGLKAVNDQRGHAAGDQLLREVAGALKDALRSYDLVLRYGGDEFVCALSNADSDHAERRLRDVADILRAAPSRGSVAWGVAELQPEDTLDDLLARADASLYAERRGKRHS